MTGRPLWLLGAVIALCLAHLGLELLHAYAWLWLADLPLLALLLVALWKWWPRGGAPGLLQVLFLGMAWLPLAIAGGAVLPVSGASANPGQALKDGWNCAKAHVAGAGVLAKDIYLKGEQVAALSAIL